MNCEPCSYEIFRENDKRVCEVEYWRINFKPNCIKGEDIDLIVTKDAFWLASKCYDFDYSKIYNSTGGGLNRFEAVSSRVYTMGASMKISNENIIINENIESEVIEATAEAIVVDNTYSDEQVLDSTNENIKIDSINDFEKQMSNTVDEPKYITGKQIIISDKSYFYRNNNESNKEKSYLIKGDTITTTLMSDDKEFVFGEYISPKGVKYSKWFKVNTLGGLN